MTRTAPARAIALLVLASLVATMLVLDTAANAQPSADVVQPSVTQASDSAPVDPGYGQPEIPEAVSSLDGVLISEVANGGPGDPSVGVENFIELTNYGDEPQDISGWYVYRCGQSGDGYGPQLIVPDGTVVAPGEQYTVVREGSSLADQAFADAVYDTTLHSFGFGAWLMDPDENIVDRIGRYHESIHSHCGTGLTDDGMPQTLDYPVSWAHGESIQRVDATGDIYADWIVGERTPGAPNTTEWSQITADRDEVGDIVITEFAPGGPGGYNEDFIELANVGDEPVDISGWKLWRCGDNSQTYTQSAGLPDGSVLEPGDTYLVARAGSSIAGDADVTYSTSVHWINSGAMVLTPDDLIVDRMSIYGNHRVSPCTDGEPKAMDINVVHGESYQRVADTGTNADDFVAALRTPGQWLAEDELEPVEIPESAHADDVWITELIASGPAGNGDNYLEITNLGDQPVDTSGWTLYRCEGTGRMAAAPQVADLGEILEPGESYLTVDAAAPAALQAIADSAYSVGFNQTEGYGAVLYDGETARVDGVGVYDTIPYEHCGRGLTLQNNTHSEQGVSYQRAAFDGGDSYHEFVKAERSPGTYVEHEWRDEAVPLDGQLDPVEVERAYRPDTPQVEQDGTHATDGQLVTALRTGHAGDADLDVTFRRATPIVVDTDATQAWAGTTAEVPPTSREVEGEEAVDDTAELVSVGYTGAYPFQRYEIPVEADGDVEVVWTGRADDRNELQLYGWHAGAQEWQLLDVSVPSNDGDVQLVGQLDADLADAGTLDVLVVDGPRTTGGLYDEVGVTDQDFAQPGTYDVAINHMTDTQFYSQGFVSVFTDMTAWVVANHAARDIAYSVNTGDIIENWMLGQHDPERARREFRDASTIIDLLNQHGVANGVLPGNHDNFWGRNNDLYNEYFGPQMFEDEPWWGNSWDEGDNSAHYDWFIHDDGTKFLVINLQYKPSDAQLDWANTVAQANEDWNIVLATHSYLYTDNSVEDIDRRHTARGRHIWEELVVPNDNIFLVVGGHYHGVATNYADPVTGERVNVIELADGAVAHDNVGTTGRRVVEMLADYQGYRSTLPAPRNDLHDRDTGFQRLLQFDLDAGLMAVNAYSPTLDDFEAWKYDEPAFRPPNDRYGPEDDEFVVEVDLNRPTSFTAEGWVVHGASTEVAAVTVGAGELAEHTWDEQAGGDVWYAVVSAGDEPGEVTGESVVTAPRVLADPTDPEEPGPVCDGQGSGSSFLDAPGSGHAAFIDCLAELGVVEGYADGTFGPTDDVSRGQLASFVVRALAAAGHELPAGDGSFSDVSRGSTHGAAIYQLAGAGVIRGYEDGTFGPWQSVTREQTATFVARALELVLDGELATSGASFPDVGVGGVHAVAIDKLVTAEVIGGYPDGTFGPRQPVTRAQMTRFIGNALNVLAVEGAYHGE